MIKVKDCMKPNVVTISPDATLHDAALIFMKKHVGTLVVVDGKHCLLGLMSLRELINLAIPDFVDLFKDMDFIHDFGTLEQNKPEAATLKKTVRELMIPAITVEADTGLLHAAALLEEHKLNDLPVVDKEGKLIGLISFADVGVGMLMNWQIG